MMVLLATLACLFLFSACAYWFFVAAPVAGSQATMKVDEHLFVVSLADTPTKQIRGLSGTPSLPENHGMLFPFETEDIYPFWMPNMKYDIDILWIHDKHVVEIATLPAPTLKNPIPAKYTPKRTAEWVLELPAGTAKKLGIFVGSSVSDPIR
jgi:uncharacterized membrane protein (UPF0127 family)